MNETIFETLVEELMMTMKVPQGIFNRSSVVEALKKIPVDKYEEFYNTVVKSETYGNGMKAILETAELFSYEKKNIALAESEVTQKARKMISWCDTANRLLWDLSQKNGKTFEETVNEYEFKTLTPESMLILNSVKPYYDFKQLIVNIRHYQTSVVQLNAFIQAIINTDDSNAQEQIAFSNVNIKQLAKGKRI